MSMQKLVIIGCSWGCGEWSYQDSNSAVLSHPGLTEYITNFSCLNLSRKAASNWQSLYALFNHLSTSSDFDQNKKYIIIQTDSMRHDFSEKFDIDYRASIIDAENLFDLYLSLTNMFYIKLDMFAEQFNTDIYLSGGLSDLYSDSIICYNRLKIVCKSWIKEMHSDHTPSILPIFIGSNAFEMCKKYNRYDLCDQILEHNDNNFIQYQELLENKNFGPAFGDFHPNRNGHAILANKINNYFISVSTS